MWFCLVDEGGSLCREAQYRDNMSDAVEFRKAGQQSFAVVDDVLWMKFQGEYTPDEARELLGIADDIYRKRGRVFLFADLTHLKVFGPETRRALATWKYLGTYTGVAFGVSLPLRAIGQLVLGAQRLLGLGPALNGEVFSDEAAARAWLDAERKRLDHKSP